MLTGIYHYFFILMGVVSILIENAQAQYLVNVPHRAKRSEHYDKKLQHGTRAAIISFHKNASSTISLFLRHGCFSIAIESNTEK